MNTNVDDFFEKSRNLKLKGEVESLLQQSPIDLNAILNTARTMTLDDASVKPSQYKGRNFMAETMYGNVIGLLYDNYPEYMREDDHGRPFILLAKDIRIYIKKLNEQFLPNNVTTKHVKVLNAQDLFINEEQIHVLYAGFVLDRNDWALDFKEVCIVYRNKVFYTKIAWVVDLTEAVFTKSTSIVSYLTRDANAVEDQSLVSVPRDQERKTGS